MNTKLGGINTFYLDEGKGIPVLFLHGFPLDHTNWMPVMDQLSGSGRHIAPDLRGFGQTDAPAGLVRMETYAEDSVRLMDYLKIDKAVVVGHSMGGYVTLAFAHKYPDRMLGMGLVASQARPDAPDRKTGRYDSAKSVATQGSVFAANTLPSKYSSDPAIQEQVRQIILKTQPNGIVAALMGIAEREDAVNWLESIKVPALVVSGGADMLIPPAVSHEMADKLADVEYVEIPGTGHMLMLEKPDQAAAAIRRLIDRVKVKKRLNPGVFIAELSP